MSIRGIRGATTVDENTPEAILAGTRELLLALMQANPALKPEDIASIFFTMTDDLDAVHPALAARQLGWVEVPLMCAREISVPDSVQRCVRVLIHWNTNMPQNAVRHVYLHGAATLRPEYAVNPK
ncbi:chorismate mutase [Anaerolinea sp.]|uniref:chorismate mutase n=1 Tax=Anaerolinea sp. TaxID=1872519 RepID=UPI002ACDA1C9|nr:chorismate mutase [Anaerolinea sp.]